MKSLPEGKPLRGRIKRRREKGERERRKTVLRSPFPVYRSKSIYRA
jgi:hypothetical protein